MGNEPAGARGPEDHELEEDAQLEWRGPAAKGVAETPETPETSRTADCSAGNAVTAPEQ